ncbi:MAG: gamma-glutamylcyclotransferase family protein [Pyrobaculum sp.]
MYLFVYGTLKRGCVNHWLLQGAEYVGEAYAPGFTLYVDLIPYAVRAPGCMVEGEVYEAGEEVVERVDQLEFPAGYARARTRVVLKDGRRLAAWIYIHPEARSRICLAERYQC